MSKGFFPTLLISSSFFFGGGGGDDDDDGEIEERREETKMLLFFSPRADGALSSSRDDDDDAHADDDIDAIGTRLATATALSHYVASFVFLSRGRRENSKTAAHAGCGALEQKRKRNTRER